MLNPKIFFLRTIEQGILQKARESVIELLEARFDVISRSTMKIISGIDDTSVLKMLHRKAATTSSLDEFKDVMDRIMS